MLYFFSEGIQNETTAGTSSLELEKSNFEWQSTDVSNPITGAYTLIFCFSSLH